MTVSAAARQPGSPSKVLHSVLHSCKIGALKCLENRAFVVRGTGLEPGKIPRNTRKTIESAYARFRFLTLFSCGFQRDGANAAHGCAATPLEPRFTNPWDAGTKPARHSLLSCRDHTSGVNRFTHRDPSALSRAGVQ